MTTTELQQLIEAQSTAWQQKNVTWTGKMFYMTVQGGPDITSVQSHILTHDFTIDSWDDLLASLRGYTYQDTVGDAKLPRFVMDTVL